MQQNKKQKRAESAKPNKISYLFESKYQSLTTESPYYVPVTVKNVHEFINDMVFFTLNKFLKVE